MRACVTKYEDFSYFDLAISAHINTGTTITRAGIVPYTLHPITKELYLLFGIDSRSQDISDLAGSVKTEINENIIVAALREFDEETRRIFGIDILSQIRKVAWCTCFIYRHSITIFVPIKEEWCLIAESAFVRTKNVVLSREEEEMSDLLWLSFRTLSKICKGGKVGRNRMWRRIRKVFSSSIKKDLKTHLYNYLQPPVF